MIAAEAGPGPLGLLAILVLFVADLLRGPRHCHHEEDHDHHR
jgi:hypothetical protein